MHQPLTDRERVTLLDAKKVLEAVYADLDPKVVPAPRADWADFAQVCAATTDLLDAILSTTMMDGHIRGA